MWNENGSGIIMIEIEGSKERYWNEKLNIKCNYYERRRINKRGLIENWKEK
jgi:hypothetical protein